MDPQAIQLNLNQQHNKWTQQQQRRHISQIFINPNIEPIVQTITYHYNNKSYQFKSQYKHTTYHERNKKREREREREKKS